MPKALFLDRDGILIRERGAYSYLTDHIAYVPGVENFLLERQSEGYLLIVVSNQGGIAKGYYGHEHVNNLHKTIHKHFLSYGVTIHSWFYCPHHDEVSHCLCRKPSPLMLEKAISRFNIAASQSYMIGDKESDAEAGRRAGVKPLLVGSNTNLYLHNPLR